MTHNKCPVCGGDEQAAPVAWMHHYKHVKGWVGYFRADIGESGPHPEDGYIHCERRPLYYVSPAPNNAARKLAAEQAEDEGLWFEAKTTPEAYLQQALGALALAVETDCPVAKPADAFQKATNVRAAQGWHIDGGPVPILYTDEINEQQVCRDDVWICKTEHLKPAHARQAAQDGDGVN